jgi:hypothetical protein
MVETITIDTVSNNWVIGIRMIGFLIFVRSPNSRLQVPNSFIMRSAAFGLVIAG